MKKVALQLVSMAMIVIPMLNYTQGMAITTYNTIPDPSAILDVKSTSKGILIPRLTQAQRNSISNPAAGLMFYQTDNSPGFYYNPGTSVNPVWNKIGASSTWSLSRYSGTSGDNFIGTSDNQPLSFRINNQVAGILESYSHNSFLGYFSLASNSSRMRNTAMGNATLYSNITGEGNSAFGYSALYWNSSGARNNAIGKYTLYYNSTSNDNSAVGNYALFQNSLGNLNTAIGSEAIIHNSSRSYNSACGSSALRSNTTGNNNTATGYFALFSNTDGAENNTANGRSALQSNTAGDNNTAEGTQALWNNTTGYGNTAVGLGALSSNTTGLHITALGEFADISPYSINNSTVIGYGAWSWDDNRRSIGNDYITWIGGKVGCSTYSDERIKDNIKEDVPGLAFINKLRPVTYTFNIHLQNEMVHKNLKCDTSFWKGKYDIEKIKMTGFLAQEVEQAAIEAGYYFSGVQKPNNPDDLYSLRYSDFVVPLVKAVQ